MKRLRFLALLALASSTACYHITVVSGAPVAAQTIDKPWQNSFIYGLVPPPVVTPEGGCPSGVAKVETQHSFLNGLVAALTWNLYTPMQVTVTCASGPVPR